MADGGNVRGFGQLLQSLEDGQLLVDLGDKLQEMNDKLAKQADNVGKAKGELTLKLKLTCDSQGGTVMIDSEIVVKEPKAPRGRSVFWMAKGNILANENPRQTKLPLREVTFTKAHRDALKEAASPVVHVGDLSHDEDGVVDEAGASRE
jgi:hypothetical protein